MEPNPSGVVVSWVTGPVYVSRKAYRFNLPCLSGQFAEIAELPPCGYWDPALLKFHSDVVGHTADYDYAEWGDFVDLGSGKPRIQLQTYFNELL